MLAGQTAVYDGHEVALFPLDILACTQVSGPGQFSHCCGTATDWVGSYAQYPYYAPFSCHRIYQSSDTCVYLSDDEVWTPSGLMYVSIGFTHDNNPPAQSSFVQGELIGHTGTQGFVTGDHVHIVCSMATSWQYVDSGQTCGSGSHCYYIAGNKPIYEMLYITGDEQIVDTKGMTFQIYDGVNPPIILYKFKWWLSAKIIKKRKEGAK